VKCQGCRYRFIETRGVTKLDICFHPEAPTTGEDCRLSSRQDGFCGPQHIGFVEAPRGAASRGEAAK
jgi:hypothetical protein